MTTEGEVRAAVRQGEDAVISSVSGLIQVNVVPVARVQALENFLDKNGSNWGNPPSSAGLKKISRHRSML